MQWWKYEGTTELPSKIFECYEKIWCKGEESAEACHYDANEQQSLSGKSNNCITKIMDLKCKLQKHKNMAIH